MCIEPNLYVYRDIYRNQTCYIIFDHVILHAILVVPRSAAALTAAEMST